MLFIPPLPKRIYRIRPSSLLSLPTFFRKYAEYIYIYIYILFVSHLFIYFLFRKYIPLTNINLNKLQTNQVSLDLEIPQSSQEQEQTEVEAATKTSCKKAYVNVFASSHAETDAWICCDTPLNRIHVDDPSFTTAKISTSGDEWYYTYSLFTKQRFSYQALLCHPWVGTI